MMKLRHLWALAACLLLATRVARADEGMWMLGNLDKDTRRTMKELGLQLTARQLYDPHGPSLKDAVVSFGGFCSGVVVSDSGLVLTNHHCGLESVQEHSTVEHDYLRNGFVARNRSEELPNPGLFVRFLIKQENVTRRVLRAVKPGMDEHERALAVDSVCRLIADETMAEDTTLLGVVDAYYSGNEYWLSVYRDYNDVRLVFAPPSSVGKFGWEKDNWEWPRHTGDFCVFRIYAGKDNRPAGYSPDNVPYCPRYVAPVSLDGYREGDFCMTLGYPGYTGRYLSSFGIEEQMHTQNQAQIDVRSVKQDLWKQAMEHDDTLRIKYASKYDESSNYWKNSIGVNRAIERLHVLDGKRALEERLKQWIRQTPEERKKLLHLFTDLELSYKNRRKPARAQAYFIETFLNGPELVQQALSILNFDFEGEREMVEKGLRDIARKYADMDVELDKKVFVAMLQTYRDKVEPDFLPHFYRTIDTLYAGNFQTYADTLYARTELATPRGLKRFLERDTTYNFFYDPAIDVCLDLITTALVINMRMKEPSANIERGERRLTDALRRFRRQKGTYPDANSTMRLSFGTVCGYRPADGVEYRYYTTTEGIFEKVKDNPGNPDFSVQPELLDLLASRDFGRYADEKKDMKVCFLSNNDITGGNSGSAMFNGKGELLGLAFDGNWEAISSDVRYEPRLQRCIGVDVRYILFIIEKYGKASHLIRELHLEQ